MAEFTLLEATIADIRAAYRERRLTARQLVEAYLDRIERLDRNGPKINALISLNPRALEEADRLDAAFRASGPVGPLHGIPIVVKDQADVQEMPTTLGSGLSVIASSPQNCVRQARSCSPKARSASSAPATRMARSSARHATLLISRARWAVLRAGPRPVSRPTLRCLQ